MTAASAKLVRKQIMLSKDNISKLEKVARAEGTSVAEVVRLAVDYYDPALQFRDDSELMELVSAKLKQAIKETTRVSRKLNRTIEQLSPTQ